MRATIRTSSRPGRRFHPLPPRVLRPLPPARVRPLDAAGQRRVRAFCTLAYKMAWQVGRALPPRWYSVLSLHYVKGLSFEEVGKQLGMSRERARQILRKAAKRAREVFPEWVQAI